MAQSLFCETCGKYIASHYQEYKKVAEMETFEAKEEYLRGGLLAPKFHTSDILDDFTPLDLISAKHGVLKICCRCMLFCSFDKENILSGTGVKE